MNNTSYPLLQNCGKISFILLLTTFDPSDPITINTNFLLFDNPNSLLLNIRFVLVSLLGFPVYSTYLALTLVFLNDTATASTYLDKNLLVIPNVLFCSCIIVFILHL